ncbi:MAG: PAS domain S-box protein [Smithella sp.]
MNNKAATNEELRDDNSVLKQRVSELEELVAECKQEKETLCRSGLLIRAITDSAQDAILMSDAEGCISFWNPAAEHIFGYTKEEAIGRNLHQLLAPGRYWKAYNAAFNRYKKNGQGNAMRKTTELQACRKNGEEFPIELSLSGIKFENGWHAVGIVRDISTRKQTEKALRESEDLYRTFINATSDMVFLKDELFRNIVVNKPFAVFMGKPEGELIGKNDFEIMPQSAAGNCRTSDLKALKSKSVAISEEIIGEQVYETLKFPVDLGNNRTGVGGFIRNITERKRLEERLQRAEKMESIGILAGGVAHDLNNILGVMMGYSELLMLSLEKDSPLCGPVKNIMKSSERATAVVQDMLTLSRKGLVTKEVINLNSIITGQLQTPEYRNLCSQYSIRVKTYLENDLLNIKGSADRIGKTLFNLLLNAAEAVRGEGIVTIRTENKYLERPVSSYDQVNVGDYVVLTVSDSGDAISPEEMKRIFEPFYTKKVMLRSGTGLGLSVVWGTVKDHKGYIDVKSVHDKGTSFTLYFPVTRDEVSKEQNIRDLDYMGRGEKILVVDDIKEQRELAANMLKRLNYSTSTVSSGEEALQYLRGHDVDLVVLDMIMEPGIDGLDTYRRIAGMKPGQKAIIVSGFAETERVKEVQELGAGSFVKKPYIMEKIGLAVRKELGA